MEHEFFPPKFHFGVASKKSDSLSISFRDLGNEASNMKAYGFALLIYNRSITFAESNEIRSLAYANRSAVYFEIKFYDECIKSINWARESGYPKSKMYKLNIREAKCKNNFNSNAKPDPSLVDIFKLSYPASKTIPFIAECIEMDKTNHKIITNRDLKAGDVISIEIPVIHFLRNDTLYKRCSNCYESCMMNLIPCTRTAAMMFCSSTCMTNFYSNAINHIEILFDDVKLLSEMSAAFGGIEKFRKFMSNSKSTKFNQTMFDFDFSNPQDPEYNKNRMKCVLALSKEYNYSAYEETCHSMKFVSKKISKRILGILMPNLPRISFINTSNPSEEAFIPLFTSILKQSCFPNVFAVNIGNKVATIVLRPIKKGEELLFSNFNQCGFALKDHPNNVADILNYKCDCQICLDKNYTFFSSPEIREFREVSVTETVECIKKTWNYINKKPRSFNEIIISNDINNIALKLVSKYYEFPFHETKILYLGSKI